MGVLHYGNGQLFQVLEGDPASVQALYARICQNPRHCNVTTYADKAIAARAFLNRYMACRSLPPQQFIEFAGYVAPARLQLARPNLSPADAQLLRTFVLPEDE